VPLDSSAEKILPHVTTTYEPAGVIGKRCNFTPAKAGRALRELWKQEKLNRKCTTSQQLLWQLR